MGDNREGLRKITGQGKILPRVSWPVRTFNMGDKTDVDNRGRMRRLDGDLVCLSKAGRSFGGGPIQYLCGKVAFSKSPQL